MDQATDEELQSKPTIMTSFRSGPSYSLTPDPILAFPNVILVWTFSFRQTSEKISVNLFRYIQYDVSSWKDVSPPMERLKGVKFRTRVRTHKAQQNKQTTRDHFCAKLVSVSHNYSLVMLLLIQTKPKPVTR